MMKKYIRPLILIGLAVVLIATKPEKHPKRINVKGLQQMIDTCVSLVIVDIRKPQQFELAHIKNAINASCSKKLFQIIDTLGNKATYVLYCKEGERSKDAGMMLLNKYNVKVYSLQGGFDHWLRKGMPTYSGK